MILFFDKRCYVSFNDEDDIETDETIEKTGGPKLHYIPIVMTVHATYIIPSCIFRESPLLQDGQTLQHPYHNLLRRAGSTR